MVCLSVLRDSRRKHVLLISTRSARTDKERETRREAMEGVAVTTDP